LNVTPVGISDLSGLIKVQHVNSAWPIRRHMSPPVRDGARPVACEAWIELLAAHLATLQSRHDRRLRSSTDNSCAQGAARPASVYATSPTVGVLMMQ
jgi:hypothetical protein